MHRGEQVSHTFSYRLSQCYQIRFVQIIRHVDACAINSFKVQQTHILCSHNRGVNEITGSKIIEYRVCILLCVYVILLIFIAATALSEERYDEK